MIEKRLNLINKRLSNMNEIYESTRKGFKEEVLEAQEMLKKRGFNYGCGGKIILLYILS